MSTIETGQTMTTTATAPAFRSKLLRGETTLMPDRNGVGEMEDRERPEGQVEEWTIYFRRGPRSTNLVEAKHSGWNTTTLGGNT